MERAEHGDPGTPVDLILSLHPFVKSKVKNMDPKEFTYETTFYYGSLKLLEL